MHPNTAIVRRVHIEILREQLVETEAYEAGDPAMYAYQLPLIQTTRIGL